MMKYLLKLFLLLLLLLGRGYNHLSAHENRTDPHPYVQKDDLTRPASLALISKMRKAEDARTSVIPIRRKSEPHVYAADKEEENEDDESAPVKKSVPAGGIITSCFYTDLFNPYYTVCKNSATHSHNLSFVTSHRYLRLRVIRI